MVLDGFCVLDFGRYIAGPFCAALLADMGADVIRIEKVDGGDDRNVAPIAPDGSGALFMAANRNKRGMTLNPMKEEGQVIAKKLIATADVVVANLPLPALKQMGIDYESLKAVKEDIILVMNTAFGSEGGYSERVGFDTVAQAMSGAMDLTGFSGKPSRSVVLFEDYGTAMLGAFGTVCALMERDKSGKGQIVETSLMKTGLNYMNPLIMEKMMACITRQQQGNRSFWGAPADTYKTQDGWLVVSVLGQSFFKRWTELVNRPDLLNHPLLQTDASRSEHVEMIDKVMVPWCKKRTTEQAIRELNDARISCAPVYTINEVISDEEIMNDSIIKNIPYPDSENPVPYVDTPVSLSQSPGSVRTAAPVVGADTEMIMTELGYNKDEIVRLKDNRVI